MSLYFVNLSNFMGLVAKKMHEKKKKNLDFELYEQGWLGKKMKNMIYWEEHLF